MIAGFKHFLAGLIVGNGYLNLVFSPLVSALVGCAEYATNADDRGSGVKEAKQRLVYK